MSDNVFPVSSDVEAEFAQLATQDPSPIQFHVADLDDRQLLEFIATCLHQQSEFINVVGALFEGFQPMIEKLSEHPMIQAFLG